MCETVETDSWFPQPNAAALHGTGADKIGDLTSVLTAFEVLLLYIK